MHRFTIKDLENLCGIKAHTIRIWEKRYALLKPQRSDTNIRFYSAEDLRILFDVCLLNKYGYKISAITNMPPESLQSAIANLKQPEARDECISNNLLVFLIKLDLDSFEKLLNAYINANGIAAGISNIIAPFLEKITLLLKEKHFNDKAVKIFSNIIRQKIIAGIEKQNSLYNNKKIVLAFLPEGDHNEVELLYVQYLMKQQGLHVIYLGANVPLNDVFKITLHKKPDYVFTQLNNNIIHFKTGKYLEKLSVLFKEFEIIIMGKLLQHYKKNVPANIQLKYSLAEVVECVL